MPFAIFFITLFIFLKTKFVKVFHKTKPVPYHLPPGPQPWPIVGSVPEMWKNRPAYRWIHRVMKELNTEIACFRLGKSNVVAVSSPEIAREFLKKNDAIFASRPLTITSGILSRGFLGTVTTPWGEQWKKMKRVLISDMFNQSNIRWLLKKRNEEADNLVRFVYNQCSISNGGSSSSSPSSLGHVVNVRTAAQHYSASVIRKMMFGKRYFGKGREDGGPGDEEEEHISALYTILLNLYAFSVSDYLPWLRVLTLTGKNMEAEDLLDVFVSLKHENGDPLLSPEEIKAQITEILLATVDNPANAAEWALSEMLNRPQQLQKAVEELDSVVGKDRLVQEHDIPNLHYINACAREALRLHPMAPFNLPHQSVSDCVVGGYFIPKGSSILLSRLGLGRNPGVWEDPMRFDPERHLKDGVLANQRAVALAEPELRFITFTVGRRSCLGGWLGSTITVMLFARLLQGFTWSMPPGVEKIDLTEADSLLKAMPLYAHAKPRLSPTVYPAN
ncbi:hypothetical protein FNV43_RR02697 [Rhamnella rubrinervis]|uniref:Cytochrome P450 n=1 Tax=Rhamnella rubrinervis TaxID=2594499 RepID=A0A8K0HIC8_9ROSA|nr:hypothetical protein FNV43_RR02697 [Rhamnella rubrinervis]